MNKLDAAAGGFLHGNVASDNVLDSLTDARPVTESDKRDLGVLAPRNKIYETTLATVLHGSVGINKIPLPSLAKRRSVSLAAERSDTPSPA